MVRREEKSRARPVLNQGRARPAGRGATFRVNAGQTSLPHSPQSVPDRKCWWVSSMWPHVQGAAVSSAIIFVRVSTN